MEPPTKRIHLSIESAQLRIPDTASTNLFASRPRLYDITPEPSALVFTRQDADKSLSERLARIWAERGDFSKVTVESIMNPPEVVAEEDGVVDERLTSTGMRELQTSLLDSLSTARTELLTALDLLSVLSPPDDPPQPEGSLPLKSETLTLVPTLPPPPLSTDPAINSNANLPIATSLASIKSTANSFFNASKSLSPVEETIAVDSTPSTSKLETQWDLIHKIQSTTSYSLIPLGAIPGSSITLAKDVSAREVGVFFGCEEGLERFRRISLVKLGDLVTGAEFKGRRLVVRVKLEEEAEECYVWDCETEGVEGMLTERGKSIFGEELFAQISEEARSNLALKAKLVLGKRSIGDSILMDGHGWSLSITMVAATSTITTTKNHKTALILLSLIRLLLLQDYSLRRQSLLVLPPSKPILAILSTLMLHCQRLKTLKHNLNLIEADLVRDSIAVEVEYVDGGKEESGFGEASLKILNGKKELGGLVIVRVGKFDTFQITFSLQLPHHRSSGSSQTLNLRSPGTGGGIIAIPSLVHLQTFLQEQIKGIVKEIGRGYGK